MSTLATLGYTVLAAIGLASSAAAATVFWLILTRPVELAQLLVGQF